VLEELSAIAPVHAVRGNTDPAGFPGLNDALELELGGLRIHVSHGHELGSPTPEKLLATYAADVIVYGHTHKQLVVNVDRRWVINPGAAGAQRFKLKPSVARMMIADGKLGMELVELG
jgi:putative phosphoesterase